MKDKDVIITKCVELENTYSNLPEKLYSRQNPSDSPSPKLVIFNDSLADELGLNKDFLKSK